VTPSQATIYAAQWEERSTVYRGKSHPMPTSDALLMLAGKAQVDDGLPGLLKFGQFAFLVRLLKFSCCSALLSALSPVSSPFYAPRQPATPILALVAGARNMLAPLRGRSRVAAIVFFCLFILALSFPLLRTAAPRVVFNLDQPPDSEIPIPKLIWQIFFPPPGTPVLDHDLVHSSEWIEMAPGYTYTLVGTSEADRFIALNFHDRPEIAATYHALKNPVSLAERWPVLSSAPPACLQNKTPTDVCHRPSNPTSCATCCCTFAVASTPMSTRSRWSDWTTGSPQSVGAR